MIITALQSGDIPQLLVLEEACFPAVQRWGEYSWGSELDQPERAAMAVRSVAERLDAAALFGLQDDTAEVLRVMTAPQSRHRGLARRLLMAGLDWASAYGARRVLLEVGETNQVAQPLYRHLGFQPIAIRKDYYGPGDSAVVMERQLDRPEALLTGGHFSDE